MEKAFSLLMVICLITAITCNKRPEVTQNNDSHNQILLVNLGNSDRAAISHMIKVLTRCKPRIIAINAIFSAFNATKEDSMLLNAIKEAKNVVLATDLVDGKLVSSDTVFLRASMAQGVVDYGDDDNEFAASFRGYIPVANQVLWSFPVTVVSYFNIDQAEALMNDMKANTYYDINTSWQNIPSEIVNSGNLTEFDCRRWQDKIVILGYLGPDKDRDSYTITTDSSTVNMYGTVIMANIIDQLLNHDFKESRQQPLKRVSQALIYHSRHDHHNARHPMPTAKWHRDDVVAKVTKPGYI